MSMRPFTVAPPHGAADVRNCTRKARMHTKQAAREAAARSSRRGTKIYFYECPVCGGYHLSSVPQDLERAKRRAQP